MSREFHSNVISFFTPQIIEYKINNILENLYFGKTIFSKFFAGNAFLIPLAHGRGE